MDTIGMPAPKKSDSPPPQTAEEKKSQYAQQLGEVPEFADYGVIFNSSAKVIQLTEAETEYQVSCIKHVFKEHVVFQVTLMFRIILKSALLTAVRLFSVQCFQHTSRYRT